MGGPKSLKAYHVSERLTLDYISKYIKCCCTLTGYLIGTVLQRGRTVLQQPGRWGSTCCTSLLWGPGCTFPPHYLCLG